MVTALKPGVGQNVALHASSATRSCVFQERELTRGKLYELGVSDPRVRLGVHSCGM